MPITLYDEDGNPQEVPSAEEITALKESQSKVDVLLKEKEELEKNVNPNFKQMRETQAKLVAALKANGKDVDAEGNVIEKNEVNRDEIIGETRKMIQEETFSSEKERLLSQYSEEDKKTINVYLDKLMTGEEKNITNLHKFIGQTVDFIFPGQENKSKRSAFSSNGSGPDINNDNKISETATAIGSALGHSQKDLEEKASPVIQF